MTLELNNGIYRTMETPFRVGKSKVFQLFDLDGISCGFRRKLTNKELRQKKLNKNNAWIVVNDWELK
ncbi:MAG: hypothetical protein ACTSW7_00680 [Candidatus Thorarchaeota archaeon]|nr:MAG: hypothetical protein DRQ25_15440 [Candidatus Fermentibacteria bacterium]HEC72583.1 hypothetical protein [Thermoplasmatales archaeon]